ncbi:uncharacterized protein BJX67DRAFT_230799 [Aspergillus lucknowensis]|uniref:Uncharacterized protein n=1 Tax=Aspergillus lucknowensis TaxID=176173 RepID=A0ABR4LH59_9EURO
MDFSGRFQDRPGSERRGFQACSSTPISERPPCLPADCFFSLGNCVVAFSPSRSDVLLVELLLFPPFNRPLVINAKTPKLTGVLLLIILLMHSASSKFQSWAFTQDVSLPSQSNLIHFSCSSSVSLHGGENWQTKTDSPPPSSTSSGCWFTWTHPNSMLEAPKKNPPIFNLYQQRSPARLLFQVDDATTEILESCQPKNTHQL